MDLDYLPHICLTLITFFVVQAWMMDLKASQRTKLAVQQREDYFAKLTQEVNKTEEELTNTINKLREENERLAGEMKKYGLDLRNNEADDDEDQLKKDLARLERERDSSHECDEKIATLCEKLEFHLSSDGRWQEELNERIRQLTDDNKSLMSQIEGQDMPIPIGMDSVDSKLSKHIEEHGSDYTVDSLKGIYDTLLKMDRANLVNLVSDHTSYETDYINLERERAMAEARLKRAKDRYKDELNAFKETRLEYLFKSTGARNLLDALKEKNNISEMIVQALKEDLELRKNETSDRAI